MYSSPVKLYCRVQRPEFLLESVDGFGEFAKLRLGSEGGAGGARLGGAGQAAHPVLLQLLPSPALASTSPQLDTIHCSFNH